MRGKTGGRIVGVEATLYCRLRAHVEGGYHGGGEDDAPLFLALWTRADGHAEPLTPSGVHQIVQYLGEGAGSASASIRTSSATATPPSSSTAAPTRSCWPRCSGHSSLAMFQNVYARLASCTWLAAMLRRTCRRRGEVMFDGREGVTRQLKQKGAPRSDRAS